MTTLCPAGHESQATDYCDTCGVAIPAGGAAPVAAPSTPDAGTTSSDPAPSGGVCPNCQAGNPVDALFCEACGYDFTTGTAPRPLTPPAGVPAAGPTTEASPATPPAPAPPADPAAGPGAGVSAPATANPSPAPTDQWVAEVWIDPDWYVDQKSEDPLPSPGLPSIVHLKHSSILIGRASQSRNITPDIDLSSDNGISRRHAQLTTDGTRWFVEDLGSSNGTYVGNAVGGLPQQAITPGQKREIGRDDRVYLGAWTRIAVRKAETGEV